MEFLEGQKGLGICSLVLPYELRQNSPQLPKPTCSNQLGPAPLGPRLSFVCLPPCSTQGMHRSFTRQSWSPSRTRIPFWQMGFSKFTELWLNGKNPRPTPAYKERHHLSTLYIHCAPGLPISPRTTPPSAWGREQGRSVLPKSLSTLFLFLLLLLLQLPLLDTAEVGLPNATGLADGLQETGTPSRGVHHLFRGSLD